MDVSIDKIKILFKTASNLLYTVFVFFGLTDNQIALANFVIPLIAVDFMFKMIEDLVLEKGFDGVYLWRVLGEILIFLALLYVNLASISLIEAGYNYLDSTKGVGAAIGLFVAFKSVSLLIRARVVYTGKESNLINDINEMFEKTLDNIFYQRIKIFFKSINKSVGCEKELNKEDDDKKL